MKSVCFVCGCVFGFVYVVLMCSSGIKIAHNWSWRCDRRMRRPQTSGCGRPQGLCWPCWPCWLVVVVERRCGPVSLWCGLERMSAVLAAAGAVTASVGAVAAGAAAVAEPDAVGSAAAWCRRAAVAGADAIGKIGSAVASAVAAAAAAVVDGGVAAVAVRRVRNG